MKKEIPSVKNVKAILIDIDNTLLDFDKSAEMSMRMAYSFYNLDCPDDIFTTFKGINDELWLKIERGEMTRETLHKIRWNTIFKLYGTQFDGETFEKKFIDNLFDCAVPVIGAKDILEYLSKKYAIYGASNAFYNQQVNRLKIADMLQYFKGLFVSETVGFTKPEKGFFDYCFSNIPYTKDETMMIGDSLSADIDGGKDYGLTTCWFNFSGQKISAPKADFIVYKLEDIKKIF